MQGGETGRLGSFPFLSRVTSLGLGEGYNALLPCARQNQMLEALQPLHCSNLLEIFHQAIMSRTAPSAKPGCVAMPLPYPGQVLGIPDGKCSPDW